jgi:hypothetical protein
MAEEDGRWSRDTPGTPGCVRNDAKLETVHPDAMHRPLFIAALFAPHEEVPGRDRRALRLGKPRH